MCSPIKTNNISHITLHLFKHNVNQKSLSIPKTQKIIVEVIYENADDDKYSQPICHYFFDIDPLFFIIRFNLSG